MTIGITSHEESVVFLAARPNDHERYKKYKKTRNATKLHKCCKRTNYVIYTLSNKGVNIWNTLHTKFKRINSYKLQCLQKINQTTCLLNHLQLICNDHRYTATYIKSL
jgi:uncharacterized protein YaeQ